MKMCPHIVQREMTTPNNYMSRICLVCFQVRHGDLENLTAWHEHGFKNVGDWYREAAEEQDSIDAVLEGIEKTIKTNELKAKNNDILELSNRVTLLHKKVDESLELLKGFMNIKSTVQVLNSDTEAAKDLRAL